MDITGIKWSAFAQDTWKASHSLTLTYGMRWEYNAPPSSPNGTLPFTVIGADNVRTMTLAPAGTPLWMAQKHDFAPRLGFAWQPFGDGKTVIRGGGGTFYNNQTVLNNFSAFPGAVPRPDVEMGVPHQQPHGLAIEKCGSCPVEWCMKLVDRDLR